MSESSSSEGPYLAWLAFKDLQNCGNIGGILDYMRIMEIKQKLLIWVIQCFGWENLSICQDPPCAL